MYINCQHFHHHSYGINEIPSYGTPKLFFIRNQNIVKSAKHNPNTIKYSYAYKIALQKL